MRFRIIGFAASMLLVSAGFASSFAQSATVSEKTFDWIFFAIVGIPFVLALVELFSPALSDRFMRERSGGVDARRSGSSERPGPTRPF